MKESITQPRALMPSKLEQQETLQTLNQWHSVFKNYYRRCSFYGYFLQPGIRWTGMIHVGSSRDDPFSTQKVKLLDHPGMISILDHHRMIHFGLSRDDPIWIIPGWSILHPKSQTVYIERTYNFGSSSDDPCWIILGWSILDHPGMIHSPPQKSNCIYRMIIHI